ncbi:MAG: FtsX-like permease family protein, partial [Acidimicrobiia bacterium]
VAVAVAASPSLPIGLGRRADPDLGVHADWAVLGAGALAALGAGLVLAGLTAWRAVRAAGEPDHDSGRRRPSRLVNGLSRSGTPPWATIGTGYALGRGLGAGTRRGALPGAVVGVTGVLAVTLFGLSLDRTQTDPGRYGWGQWDGVVSSESNDEDATAEEDAAEDARLDALVLSDPAVAAVSLVRFRTEVVLDGEPVLGLVLSPRRGRAGPTVLSGRLPEGGGEIALGSATAGHLGKRIGERIDARVISGREGGPDGEEPAGDEPAGEQSASPAPVLKVVGIAAFPAVEDGLPLSDGFVLTNDEWAGLGGAARCEGECFRNHVVALADGADGDAFAARMARQGAFVGRPQPGAEIARLDEVQSLPRILALLLGLLAALGVAHTLWVTPRRRRRDLATLRTLGFTPVQVRRVLHTQAAVLATAGAAGGLVGGAIAGR